MHRREFLAAAASLAIAGAAPAERPDVLLLIGAAGTPPPDRLASEGVRFTRAYAACPAKSVFRSGLLTGTFPHARGVRDELLHAVDARAADTFVLFTTEPAEDSPSEAATHVPLILYHPKRLKPAECDFLVSTVDMAPTILGLAGAELPSQAQGRNLAALLTTGKGERPESIYAEGQLGGPGEWRMVVRGLDKLVVTRDLDVIHLFNLGEDPAEETDLAKEPGHRLKVDELKALVQAWMKRTRDGMDPSGLRRR